MRAKKRQAYWIEYSVRPADGDDPGYAEGMRVESLDDVVKITAATFSNPWLTAGNAVNYLRQNGYR